jgi:hypothetical protein
MYKIVVSFTTSPSRLYRVEPVIQSMFSQDYKPLRIEINLPDKYKNKEEYTIPDFLKPSDNNVSQSIFESAKYPTVFVVRTGRDIGPSSKVIPTLIRYKDDPEFFVVSIDDDHMYPNKVISTLVKGLHLYGDKAVYGIGGLDVYLTPKMGISMYSYEKTYTVGTIEGVFGVLYNPRVCIKDSNGVSGIEHVNNYYDKIMNCSECITSDDVTISNYLAMKNVPIVKLHFKHMSRNKLKGAFSKGLTIKESDKDGNAIHMMPGGHSKRYFSACAYLKSENMLHLSIKKGSKFR